MSRLLYLMGASGSGKDSLLDALRQHLPTDVAVAHRYITRPADAGAENHIALSETEFLSAASSVYLPLNGMHTSAAMAWALKSTAGCNWAVMWWSTAHAPIWTSPVSVMVSGCCRCVCRFQTRCWPHVLRNADAKMRRRLPVGFSAPESMPARCPPNAIC